MKTLSLLLTSMALMAQTNQPVPLRVYTQNGIAADTVIDNRSTVNRSLRFVTIACSGSGTWSAALLYGSTTSSFSSYGSAATVANSDTTPTAWGFLYTSPNYIKVDLTGTVTCNFSGYKDLYSTGTSGNVTYPIAVASGGTGATDAATARTNLGVPWTVSGSNIYYTTGNVSIGTSSLGSKLLVTENSTVQAAPSGTVLHVAQTNGAGARLLVDSYAEFPSLTTRRSNGTSSSPTALTSGDQFMSLIGLGYGASEYSNAGIVSIRAKAAGTWTNTSMPGYLIFETTPSASVTAVERWRISEDGHLLAGTDNSWDFGNDATYRPRDVNVARNLKIGGAATLGTALSVANGGTGATTASGARTNLGIIDSLTSRQSLTGTKDSANDTFTVTIGGSWTVSFVDVLLNGVILPSTGYSYSSGTITMDSEYVPASSDAMTALIYYSAAY